MKKGYINSLFNYGIFIFLTLLTTYPLVFKIKNCIPGFFSTDEPYAALWNLWWLKYAWLKGLPSYDYSTVAVPFGINYLMRFSIFPIWDFINKWLTILTNNFVTYNIEVVLSFFLAALCMYYLVNFVTKNKFCAVFAGIAYAFCPYHFVRAWQHLGLAQIQYMPLYLLSLLVLVKNISVKRAIIAVICFYLVISFDFYYAYFMFISTVVFFIFLLFFIRADKNYRGKVIKSFVFMAALILVLILPIIFAIVNNQSNIAAAGMKGVYSFVRPFNDLFTQSARPLSYFLPASTHPIFGRFTEQFVGTSSYGQSFTEHVLYLGWMPIILAFITFKKWRKNKKQEQSPQNGDSPLARENFYIGFFVFLAFAAWLFSQPPWWNIGPIKIFMPSFFMYKILPMFRAYCRFGIVVMLAVAVLAGFGLKFILERFKTQRAKVAVTALFCSLILFDFWNYPPFKVIDFSETPAVYAWLKRQSNNLTIAEYPIDTNGANVMYMFYQTKHEKKIINGTIPGTHANKVARSITKLSDLQTAGVLKWMGVRYALVHREDYLNTELTEDKEELDKIPKNTGLKFIKSFLSQECPQKDIMCVQKTGPIDVYEVVAQPVKPAIDIR